MGAFRDLSGIYSISNRVVSAYNEAFMDEWEDRKLYTPKAKRE